MIAPDVPFNMSAMLSALADDGALAPMATGAATAAAEAAPAATVAVGVEVEALPQEEEEEDEDEEDEEDDVIATSHGRFITQHVASY